MPSISTIVFESLHNLANLSTVTKSYAWDNLSLAGGYPGLILLFSQLEKEGQWDCADQVVHLKATNLMFRMSGQ